MATLFDPIRLGSLILSNRIAVAPMTRNRADQDGRPNALMAEYYAQRATFGLIITEGVQPVAIGQAYPATPGIHNDAQEAGWREVADAVHSAGGHIFVQLVHAGRISHPDVIGVTPMAPSAIAPAGKIFTGTGMKPFGTPREMSDLDLTNAKAAFVDAARRAVAAGCNGVEIHCANGYLLHQFLADNSNQRRDQYGGSPENRARFVSEVMRAIVAEVGGVKVGIRISPNGEFNDMKESQVQETYGALLAEIADLGLAYLHIADQSGFDGIGFSRKNWPGTLIVNTGYADEDKVANAKKLVEQNVADMVSFGRLALGNPDLPRRIREGAEMNALDSKTFYSSGAKGYTDYPTLAFS